ncbi:hypothetical protein [Mycoplasma sp. SG1]|uniref:hypothetical protein n=1 Tax=Mycoplasma sp. SG1 TaxID=2810348 RepID=UPI002024AEEC|nr:hypothetical protein [Mycoplasma sp. SG1]URM53101.1 hypothetical protein JRW51_02005 [Mycoplasma sp. SG1]
MRLIDKKITKKIEDQVKNPILKIIKSGFFQDIKNILNFKKSVVLFSYVVRLKILSSYILFFANVTYFLIYIFSLFLFNSEETKNGSNISIELFFWVAVIFNLLVYFVYIFLNSWTSKVIKSTKYQHNLLAIVFLVFLSFIILIFLVSPETSQSSMATGNFFKSWSLVLSIIGFIFILLFMFSILALDHVNNQTIKKMNGKITSLLKEIDTKSDAKWS